MFITFASKKLELKPKPFDEEDDNSASAMELMNRKFPIMSIILNYVIIFGG
jgi:hypothetical protein